MSLDFDTDVGIDPDSLDIEWLRQATLYMRYATEAARRDAIVKRAKESLEVADAQIDREVRRSADKRLTEAQVSAAVMLEQIRGVEDKEQAMEAIRSSKVEEKQVIDLCRALIGKQAWPEIAAIVKDLAADDYEKVRRAVLGYCASVLLNKASNQAALVIDCFREPFYNTGKAGLVAACYEVVSG